MPNSLTDAATAEITRKKALAGAADQLRMLASDHEQMCRQKETLKMPTEKDVRDKLTYRYVAAVLRNQAIIIERM